VEEFKRGMNRVIRRKLMEVERPPRNIDQWYEHTTNLDRHWRESKKKEERLRDKKEIEGQGQKQMWIANSQEGFRPHLSPL